MAAAAALVPAGRLAAQPAPAPTLPRLTGVVIGNGERRALFAAPDATLGSAAEGEDVGGYAVLAITASSVQLRDSAGTYTVGLTPDPAFRASMPLPPAALLAEAQRQADEDNNK